MAGLLSVSTPFLQGAPCLVQSQATRKPKLLKRCTCDARQQGENASVEVTTRKPLARRELMLNSVSGLFLGSLFNFNGAPPTNLGLKDYGKFKSLALCPPTPNCISTAEEANDYSHFVPAWTYKGKKPKTQEQAMEELKAAVLSCKEGKFTASIVKETPDYLRAEFQSSFFGFVDDVEFYFHDEQVEYRTASRQGESDFDANRKRIRALRKELQKSGWSSVGF